MKTAETKAAVIVNTIDEKLAKLNLNNFVKNGQGRKTIYKVDESIQNDERAMKIFRRNLRREKTQICLKVVREYSETKKLSNATLNEFKKFYAEKFITNDFSNQSFSSVNEEKDSAKLYELTLEIVKTSISK